MVVYHLCEVMHTTDIFCASFDFSQFYIAGSPLSILKLLVDFWKITNVWIYRRSYYLNIRDGSNNVQKEVCYGKTFGRTVLLQQFYIQSNEIWHQQYERKPLTPLP